MTSSKVIFPEPTSLQELMKKQKQEGEKKELEHLIRKYTYRVPVGIPTTDGFEFVKVQDVIRCERMQKCTRVIINHHKPIISPCHIGKFKNKLEPFGFFSPHKSYVINLSYIKSYHKEGVIKMVDQTNIPLVRRKKNDFLDRLDRIA